jgi:hypothetical protein
MILCTKKKRSLIFKKRCYEYSWVYEKCYIKINLYFRKEFVYFWISFSLISLCYTFGTNLYVEEKIEEIEAMKTSEEKIMEKNKNRCD